MANRAWMWRGGSQWDLGEVPIPDPRHGEVRIKVGSVGFCGSERKLEKLSVEDLTPGQLSELPMAGGRGHEVAGVVDELGPGVTNCKPGDRVAILHNMGCKRCRFCTSGFENNCPTPRESVHIRGYADYIAVPSSLAYIVPDEMPMDQASMVEPCAIGVHAVEMRTKVRPGETVVVFGVGQIGSFAAQMAQISGGRVIAVDPRELARQSARDLGLDVGVDPSTQNVREVVMEETHGLGADAILECAGDRENYGQFLELLAPCGRIVQVGHWGSGGAITLDLMELCSKEGTLVTSRTCVGTDYDRTLELARWGKLKLNWMDGRAITNYSMDEFLTGRQEWIDEKNLLYTVRL